MAGTPTKAECFSMMTKAVDILEKGRAYGTDTLLGALDTLEQSVEGDFAPAGMVSQTVSTRNTVASACSRGRARAYLDPVMRELGRLAGSRFWNGAIGSLLPDVRRYLLAQGPKDTIEERNITFGAISANGSNTGTGTLERLYLDDIADDIDSGHTELKTAECVKDQNTGGRRHNELFTLKGADAGLDSLAVGGSGSATTIPARHAGTSLRSGSLLKNASFQTHDGTTGTGQFSGWTATTGTNLSQDTSAHYRGFPGNTATHSLKFAGNDVLTQKISVRNTALSKIAPYYYGVAYNRQAGTGDGTLRLRLGSQTITVALVAQTGWNILKIPLDENSYWANFNEDELDLTIELESWSTGYVLVDDAIFCPLTPFDQTWWLLRGGATPFMAANATLPHGDSFTQTDSGGGPATAKNSYWINHRAYGEVYRGRNVFPTATSGAETVADP